MDYFSKGKVANPKLTLYAFHLKHSLAQKPKQPVKNANHLWLKCQQLGKQLGVSKLETLPALIEKANSQKTSITGEILPEQILNFTTVEHQNNLQLSGEANPLEIHHDTYALDLTLRYPYPEVKIADLRGLNPEFTPFWLIYFLKWTVRDSHFNNTPIKFWLLLLKIDCIAGTLSLRKSLNSGIYSLIRYILSEIINQDSFFLPKNINASLGQTLVFFAQPIGKIDNEQAFANACIKGLLSEKKVRELNIYCQDSGKLLGSPIFEYNNNADSIQKQCHILIWLNTHSLTTELEEKGEYYYPLIDLLLCHSKIIYARSEAIWCDEQSRAAYSDLENYKQQFQEQKNNPIDLKLDKFKQWLHEIPPINLNYVDYLRHLELHKTTIQTNSKNYRRYLNKLKRICVETDDLEFLSKFLELAEDTFVEQINTNLTYLTPAQNSFDQITGTIRGIVEVEQAKRDRSLERTIQVIGIAFGGGAIVSGVVNQHIDKPFAPINFKSPVHPLVSSLLWSLLATVIFGLVAWLVTKPKRKRNKQK